MGREDHVVYHELPPLSLALEGRGFPVHEVEDDEKEGGATNPSIAAYARATHSWKCLERSTAGSVPDMYLTNLHEDRMA